MIRKHFLLLIFTLAYFASNASHIVGGVVTYRYLGNNKYELTFKVYRDCSSQTTFDGDPSITGPNASKFWYSIYQNNQTFIDSNSLYFSSKNNVPSAVTNPCLDTNNVCVEQAIYLDTITITDPTKSYTIVHQRCCRNDQIDNIQPNTGGGGGGGQVFPGMTIYTVIPATSTYSNNSAVFKKFPPLFLCKDQQFNFDHSATDIDGDQLKYYLVTPLDGGNFNNPVPRIATTTKTPIAWQSPYSLSNILGGAVNMSIDENSGYLSCKPDLAGRFVVSVMVKEYRNGVAIDSSIRDFQFNVKECDIPKSDLPFVPGSFDPVSGMADYQVNCKNKTVSFNNTSTNSTGFFWNFGEPSSGINDTSSAVNPSHTYADTGVYIVSLISYKLRNDNTLCSDTLRIRVRIYPVFNAKFTFPTSPPICKGNSLQFTDVSTGTYGTTNKWYWDFGDGGTATIQNPQHSFASSGSYNVYLRAENSKKCVDDTAIQVVVNPSPTIGASIPNSCIGQPMILNCNNTVSPGFIQKQRWTLPNKQDTSCSSTYVPPNLSTFNITMWAMSDKGCIDSQIYSVPVNALPTIATFQDTFICYDAQINLFASGGVSYLWSPASQLSNPNIPNPIGTPIYPNSTNFIVKGTDAKGCYNFDTVLVRFHVKPFISAGADTNVCFNPSPFKFRDSVQLNGQGNFATVLWTPSTGLNNPNISNPRAKPKVTTDYIYSAVDQFGCRIKDTVNVLILDPNFDLIPQKDVYKCVYDTIKITPVDQGIITKYVWSPNVWVSNNLKRDPLFYSRDTTLYILYVENYCYNKYDSIRVDVIPSPKTGMINFDSICKGDTYQFNLNPAYTYFWNSPDTSLSSLNSNNPTAKPIVTIKYYRVTAVEPINQCKTKDSMELKVNYPPLISLKGVPKFLCLGDSVKIRVASNMYAWLKWSPNTDMYNDTSWNPIFWPTNNTNYILKAYSAWNCFSTDTLKIKVQKPIIPIVQSPVHVCKGKFIDLYASGGLYYLWKNPYQLNDSFIFNPQVSPDTNFSYRVQISNDCFSDFDTVDVIVDSLPKVYASIDTSIYRGQEIELTASSAASILEWSPERAIKSSVFSNTIKISPLDSTMYYVEVIDGNNCKGRDSVLVAVYGKNVLLIPTAFSPNNDGKNDVFKVVKHLNVRTLNYFEVFNRWGEKLFSTDNIEKGWDGKVGDLDAPSGTYIWNIRLLNYDNQRIEKSGSVELIR